MHGVLRVNLDASKSHQDTDVPTKIIKIIKIKISVPFEIIKC